MVRTIPHRELRNNSSKILEEVRRGETIHITNHGEVVATSRPPRTHIPWSAFEIPPAREGQPPIAQEYWDEFREDRL